MGSMGLPQTVRTEFCKPWGGPDMAPEEKYSTGEMTRLGMAGMARNVGFGVNKVFAADLLSLVTRSQPLIGLVLGMEGLMGLVLNPLTGWLSDRYTTPWGRRRPYLLIAFPFAAVSWVLFTYERTLGVTIASLITFYFFQQLSPTPYQAWMPDITPRKFWGKASGILNFWWLVGNFVAFLPIPLLWHYLHQGAFWLTGAIIMAGGLITTFGVREAPIPKSPSRDARPRLNWVRGNIVKYFVAQCLWWLAFESMASFFTLYTIHTLHGTLIDSAIGMALFTASGMLTAITFGRLYHRRSPRYLLIVCTAAFGIIASTGTIVHSVAPAFGILFIGGIFWGGIQVVSYPWGTDLLNHALGAYENPLQYHGVLYGLVNMSQALGLLVAAPLAGITIAWQHGWYGAMFWVSVLACGAAIGVILSIHPRSSDTPVSEFEVAPHLP